MPSGVRWSRTRREGLLGEQERLEPDRRLLADEGQRVGQREDDQVVLLVGVAQECAAVVDVRRHAGSGRAGSGCCSRPICSELRIDLDRVDVAAPCCSAMAASEPLPAPTMSTFS